MQSAARMVGIRRTGRGCVAAHSCYVTAAEPDLKGTSLQATAPAACCDVASAISLECTGGMPMLKLAVLAPFCC